METLEDKMECTLHCEMDTGWETMGRMLWVQYGVSLKGSYVEGWGSSQWYY